MRLSGTDFYRIYRPSGCELRLYLHHRGVPAGEAGPFEQVIHRLGDRHEKAYLATLGAVSDISNGTAEDRQRRTLEAIEQGAAVIYQPLFHAIVNLGGHDCTVTGSPDFLIREGDGYLIRDVKMARRVNEDAHAEIIRQLQFYSWLYELVTGKKPVRLEVWGGKKEMVPIDEPTGGAIESELSRYVGIISGDKPPFEPVGWTKCGGCGYVERCWPEAEKRRDVALVLKVDQNLARALHEAGVTSYEELLSKFDERKLSEFKKPWGNKMQKVGKAAPDILRSAKAMQMNSDIPIAPPVIPEAKNFVMFDLEGLPPHLDELEKIYLWGLQVFGDKPSVFMAATAGFGSGGDRAGWEQFLENAGQILAEYGNIPFVHWHHYERTKLKMYVERYGDPDGTAAGVLANLFDLLPAAQKAVALPLPSYSLKVVEKHVGFERTQEQYGGEWAMAQYIEATEMENGPARDHVLAEILRYNEEDLAAAWAVLRWLKNFGGAHDAATKH